MRSHAIVSGGKITTPADFKTRAVAVMPRLRRMRNDLFLPIDLRRAAQCVAQNRALDLQLRGVVSVLIVASAASSKIRTARHNPVRRRLDYFIYAGAGKT